MLMGASIHRAFWPLRDRFACSAPLLQDFFNDFFMGVVRNPRLFHGILKVPFDLKRFWNARPGLTGWVILNISYLAPWQKLCCVMLFSCVCVCVCVCVELLSALLHK